MPRAISVGRPGDRHGVEHAGRQRIAHRADARRLAVRPCLKADVEDHRDLRLSGQTQSTCFLMLRCAPKSARRPLPAACGDSRFCAAAMPDQFSLRAYQFLQRRTAAQAGWPVGAWTMRRRSCPSTRRAPQIADAARARRRQQIGRAGQSAAVAPWYEIVQRHAQAQRREARRLCARQRVHAADQESPCRQGFPDLRHGARGGGAGRHRPAPGWAGGAARS